MWHKYINIAVLNYNKSYHTSIGCEPSRDFNGRIPYDILDLKLGHPPQRKPIPTSNIAQDVFNQTEMIHQDVRKNAMQVYIKYKAYFYKKKQMLQSSKKQINYASYNQKRINKGVKLHLQNFSGLALTLLKRCYLTTTIWYAKSALTRRKGFILCECASSHHANPQLTHELRHKNINLIRV